MLKERIDLSGYAEISMVATKFNQMMDQIDELTEDLIESNSQLYESEISKQRAEMAFLNSQINPHFLYNTLECIQGIAANKGVHEIKDMTAALSQIFRYSIKGGEEVSVREEFGIVERYLLIQKIRFEDRFDVIYEVDEQLLDYKIKKMLLQPIVENAVFHGLELMMERGLLHIQLCILEEKKLLMKIVDNGMGIKEERLLHIRKELDDVEKREEAIGLINVHKRIVLAYGKGYGLQIESEENKGTVVTLLLPWLGGDNRVHDSVG